MEDDVSNPFRIMSIRTPKIAPKMALALANSDNKTQRSLEEKRYSSTGMMIMQYRNEVRID
ncbi:hypothetical protein OIU76_028881 [Salix suchowensis]|nr:hypothetical protein OIU76_028881 [Salix suchowensis]